MSQETSNTDVGKPERDPIFFLNVDQREFGWAMDRSPVDDTGERITLDEMIQRVADGPPKWIDQQINFPSIDITAKIFQNGSIDFIHNPGTACAYHFLLSREKISQVFSAWSELQPKFCPPGS